MIIFRSVSEINYYNHEYICVYMLIYLSIENIQSDAIYKVFVILVALKTGQLINYVHVAKLCIQLFRLVCKHMQFE